MFSDEILCTLYNTLHCRCIEMFYHACRPCPIAPVTTPHLTTHQGKSCLHALHLFLPCCSRVTLRLWAARHVTLSSVPLPAECRWNVESITLWEFHSLTPVAHIQHHELKISAEGLALYNWLSGRALYHCIGRLAHCLACFISQLLWSGSAYSDMATLRAKSPHACIAKQAWGSLLNWSTDLH